MSKLKITIEKQSKDEERQRIFEGLHRYNAAQTNDSCLSGLSVFLRDAEDNVVGGILGEIYWGWLYVEFMWIEDSHRERGFGKELLATAEQEAIARGCGAVYLDTFSFQAPEFYKRCGYEVFGELEDFPPPHKRFFMKKSL